MAGLDGREIHQHPGKTGAAFIGFDDEVSVVGCPLSGQHFLVSGLAQNSQQRPISGTQALSTSSSMSTISSQLIVASDPGADKVGKASAVKPVVPRVRGAAVTKP